MSIPSNALLAGDADVSLDLQAAVTNVYDGFGYRYLIDYTRPPHVPLAASQWEWARVISKNIAGQ